MWSAPSTAIATVADSCVQVESVAVSGPAAPILHHHTTIYHSVSGNVILKGQCKDHITECGNVSLLMLQYHNKTLS